jgi:hypothetical protein
MSATISKKKGLDEIVFLNKDILDDSNRNRSSTQVDREIKKKKMRAMQVM